MKKCLNDTEMNLRTKLKDAIKRHPAEGLLFSGGLDTSILASLCPKITAVNVSLENFSTDLEYAKMSEKFFNLRIHYLTITVEQASAAIPEIVKMLKSFDPAIPNDITVYFGLRYAKELGLKSVMTGDGADELLAGYDYMRDVSDLKGYIQRLSAKMNFSSNIIGDFFGIKLRQPYLDRQFLDFAVNEIPVELKLKKVNRTFWGKWILRKAFEDILPKEVAWQSKRPLEFGSGMTRLREIISAKISDDEFKKKQLVYPVKFLNKEHLYYYEIFRKVVGTIPAPNTGEKLCPGCGAGLNFDAFHCKVCGYVLMSCAKA